MDLTATDVVAGGGTFSSILLRSIRRPSPLDPVSITAGGADDNNISNNGSASASAAAAAGGNNDNGGGSTSTSYDDTNFDWTTHHIDYELLERTLDYFRERRSVVRSRLSYSADTTSTAGRCTFTKQKQRGISTQDYNRVVEECARNAPFEKTISTACWKSVPVPGGGGAASFNNYNTDTSSAHADVSPTKTTNRDMEHAAEHHSIIYTPYQNMDTSSSTLSNKLLTESEIITRLSHRERTELSSLLDAQVEKAAMFYRHRVALLSPPRTAAEDGYFTCAGSNAVYCGVDDIHILPCGPLDHSPPTTGDANIVLFGGKRQKPSTVSRHTSLESNDLLIEDPYPLHTLSFSELANELLELHAFITTNLISIRQILIKYDAFVNSSGEGNTLSNWYMSSRRQRVKGRSSGYRDLLGHEKLKRLSGVYVAEYRRWEFDHSLNNSLTTESGGGGGRRANKRRWKELSRAFYKIVDSAEEIKKRQRMKWKQGVMEVSDLEDSMCMDDSQAEMGMTSLPSDATPPSRPPPSSRGTHPSRGEDIAYQIHIFKCIQSKTQRSIEKTTSGHISGWWDNTLATIRDYYLMGSASDNNMSLMPEFLIMRGKSLKRELLIIAQWREARVAYCAGEGSGGLIQQQQQVGEKQWFGGFCGESRPEEGTKTTFKAKLALFMNILACFFYMMNYYIVEPSSTRYANALGMGDAMSGLIIGAMPWAALFSAVIYSIWSNYCYRQPLLASGMLLMTGNLLYASAYRRGSITMALCGRFLTGLGGPRSMNRRYIADTTPLAYRTSVNAALGTATAMGAALGPATAIMIDGVDVSFDVPLYGTVYFNSMTGPGFIMFGLWIVFTIILALTFEEPERSGLEEQKRKEMAEAQASATGPAAALEMSNLGPSSKTIDTLGSDEFVTEQPAQASATPYLDQSFNCTGDNPGLCIGSDTFDDEGKTIPKKKDTICSQLMFVLQNLTVPVRICMFLLFSKMFTVESVISAASMVTKNRYGWQIQQVGTLGTITGCLTIPISIFIGWVSQYREDRVLMIYLMAFATLGMGLLVDVTDFFDTDTVYYNKGKPLAVGPHRYVAGYMLVFCSVQAFDGVVGSVLSKVIPTALATGTLNSGLLATLVGTFGRACGDVFITSVGFIDLRNVMNMLYIPSFCILLLDLIMIWWNYDALTA
ncbi:hypothetical protein ACHAWO_010731 [Cyclotella atomus]|uniref:SPX domain-containing protein n=1 Tax=Cyclotella atomus TaxID=382360 RepID=A0ABD3P0M9_9STRA